MDLKRKELTLQKEELLKESKSKVVTMDGVKSQIDMLVKVGYLDTALLRYIESTFL